MASRPVGRHALLLDLRLHRFAVLVGLGDLPFAGLKPIAAHAGTVAARNWVAAAKNVVRIECL